jgi:site-specific DNA-methyltransferase (adenine-specific)
MEVNKIYLGDCLEELKKIPNEMIDLIIADFPYNISDYKNSITKVGSEFKKADFGEWDKFDLEEYCLWVVKVMKEFERVLKPKHQAYCWFDNRFTGHYTYLIEKETGLAQKCPIVCYKRNPIPQIRKKNFRSSFDMCVLFTKDKDKKCEPFNFLKQEEMKNVQEYNLKKLTKHPTEKNLELIKRFINISSNKDDLILDCFAGSGTTGVACLELGRNFILVERESEYFKMASDRINKFKEQRKL